MEQEIDPDHLDERDQDAEIEIDAIGGRFLDHVRQGQDPGAEQRNQLPLVRPDEVRDLPA